MRALSIAFVAACAALLIASASLHAEEPPAENDAPSLEGFEVRALSGNEFSSFVEIFGEMRGPLRAQILKDRKSDFEDADPLQYVMEIKGEKDVQRALAKHGMTWEGFTDLFGNVLLAYFSIQPDVTKVALIKEMACYGLSLSKEQIPAEYRELLVEVLTSDECAAMANVALEYFLKIPEENIALVKEYRITLDKMFYTRFWKDEIGKVDAAD